MTLHPFPTGVITSLIANGLTALVNYGVEQVKEITKQRDTIRKSLDSDAILVTAVRDVMAKIAKTPRRNLLNSAVVVHGFLQMQGQHLKV